MGKRRILKTEITDYPNEDGTFNRTIVKGDKEYAELKVLYNLKKNDNT